MGLIKIIKKAVTEIPKAVGSIFNTTNIENKEENTYSANVIDRLNNELSDDILSKVLTERGSSSETDMNNIKTVGIHRVPSGITNYPSGASNYGGILMVFKPLEANTVLVQVLFDGKGDFVASRTYWYDSVGWSGWKTLS